jgi:hypothetical protein
MADIFNCVRALVTSAGPWLNWKWAFVIPVCLFLLCAGLIQLDVIPSVAKNEHGLTVQWWKLGTLGGFPLLGLAIWFASTQLYLHTGQGTKVGLAYEGPKVSLSDWRETRLILKDLFASGQIQKRVSLRFVPLRATQAETRGNRYMKRYSFTVLLILEDSGKGEHGKPFHKIGIGITTKKEAEPYLKTSLQNALTILAARSKDKPTCLKDLHRLQARTLHDLLLLFVATHCFVNQNYEDASAILQKIDESLASEFPIDKPPRMKIREFDAMCCIRPLSFPLSQIPEKQVMEQQIAFAERAMRYFGEFAAVYLALSRAKFLVGDIQAAVDLTAHAKEVIRTLREKSVPVSKPVLARIHLNSGFLSFVQGHWHKAHESYIAMLSVEEHSQEDWNALVSWIDYVETLECFDGVPFLQVFYRKMASQRINDALRDKAMSWLGEDGSRDRLRGLLDRAGSRQTSKKRAANRPSTRRRRPRR